MERRLARVQQLAEASRALALAGSDMDAVLRTVAEQISQAFDDGCIVAVASEDPEVFEAVQVQHPDPSQEKALRLLFAAAPIRRGQGFTGRSIASNSPVLIPEIPLEMLLQMVDPEHREAAAVLRQRGGIVAPMAVGDEVLGAISLLHTRPGAELFNEEDRDHLVDLASRCGLALRNAHAVHRLELLTAELERRVELRTAQLEASNKELEDFAYAASHDLKEPLRSVGIYAMLVRDEMGGELSPTVQEYLAEMETQVKRMGGQIQNLLEYSRVGRQELRLARVEVAASVELVRRSLFQLLQERGAELQGEELPELTCDPDSLHRILLNLVSNGVRYNVSPTPRVRVRGNPDGSISVSDNGVGIDPKHHERVFRIFYRLQRDTDGSGAGLTIVQKLVKRHGGWIRLDSEPGRGSTFTFSLGVAPSP